MMRWRRYALIRRTLATMPGRAAYPSEVAWIAGLDPYQTNKDIDRMARKGLGVHKIHGSARHFIGD